MTWVLEDHVLPALHARWRAAAADIGHAVVPWDDRWPDGGWPSFPDAFTLFHGSLGTAALVRDRSPWRPGALCDVDAFRSSSWYPRAEPWLLHRQWVLTTVEALVADPDAALQPLGAPDRVFVRPDSPLKPFAGRVVPRTGLTLAALDFGYYYDDATLPVVIAPVRAVGREWRHVVVQGRVVAGSAYDAGSRTARPDDAGGAPWSFASEVAGALDAPEPAYVLDTCEADGRLWLLELNPFSGADLYACDLASVLRAIGEWAAGD